MLKFVQDSVHGSLRLEKPHEEENQVLTMSVSGPRRNILIVEWVKKNSSRSHGPYYIVLCCIDVPFEKIKDFLNPQCLFTVG